MTDVPMRLASALADRYQIERELGAGGMATVYLAHDVRHDRKVALKVLRPELAAILGGERFLKEIRLTANLQHPHILSLFDSGEADGLVFYVMPYVEGESLRDRLVREKQLPVEDAVRIAREVAGALDYAHRHGVVHRDIKPENILLHDGSALVADFGIALAVSTAGGSTRMTETGMSLGTPHYMSPEQAMGEREITPKADIYALGCVLYEMLTAEPPFVGATAQAIIARVMTEEPRSLTLQRRTIPPHVEAAVGKALEKLPADRFATAAQFAEALGNPGFAATTAAQPASAAVRRSGRPPVRLVTALPWTLALLGLAIGAWGMLRPQPRSAPPIRFTIEPSAQYSLWDATGGTPLAFSPDGSRLVITANTRDNARPRLFLREIGQLTVVPLAGTEGAGSPFFSPDGEWVGFLADGRLRKASVSGGGVIPLTDAVGLQGSAWGERGDIVYSSRDDLLRIGASGGIPDTLVRTDSMDLSLRFPEFLPGGKVVVFTAVGRSSTRLKAVSLSSRTVTDLGVAGFNPRYVEPGYMLYGTVEGNLFAAPFDARRLRFTGPATVIAENVRYGGNGVVKMAHALRGSIAYLGGGSGGRRELILADRTGRARPAPAPPNLYESPRFSPDGRRIAVAVGDLLGGASDIWTFDLLSGALSRVTFDSASTYPEWSRDGQWVHFATRRGGNYDLWRARSDGSGVEESLLVAPADQWEGLPMPDGSGLVFRTNEQATKRDILFLPRGAATPTPILRTPFEERSLALSRDGHWLAYVSDETGTDEIYVRGVPGPGGRVQLSVGGGAEPRWSPNGRELFYMSRDSVIAVEVVPAGAELRPGRRTALFANNFFRGGAGNHPGWDVGSDGRTMVFVRSRSVAEEDRITVFVNGIVSSRAATGTRRE